MDNFDCYQTGFAQSFANQDEGKEILNYITQRDPKYKAQALKTAQKRQSVLNLTEKDMLTRLGKQAGTFLKNEAKVRNGRVILSGYAEHVLFPSKENSLKLDAGYYQGKHQALEHQRQRQLQKQEERERIQQAEKQKQVQTQEQNQQEPANSLRFNKLKPDNLGL